MTAFRELWDIPSFRRSFRDLATVDGDLMELAQRAARGDAGAEDDGLGDERAQEFRNAQAVLETLRRIFETEGRVELLEDLIEVAGDEGRFVATQLDAFLSEEPERAEERLVQRAQYGVLPVATGLSAHVDFRTMRGAEDRTLLVPVIVLRLDFDEPIAGGSDAVVFQLPDEGFAEFASVLKRAEVMRSEMIDALPAALLPNVLPRSIGAESSE